MGSDVSSCLKPLEELCKKIITMTCLMLVVGTIHNPEAEEEDEEEEEEDTNI